MSASTRSTTTENVDTRVAGLTSSAPGRLTDCDGHGIFSCPTGTCYTGMDGFVGCCSISKCAARTTCLEYNPSSTTNCDINTGGCITCSNTASPACVTISNALANQYIMYCGTSRTRIVTQYENPVVTGSVASNRDSTSRPSSHPKPSTSTSGTSNTTKSAIHGSATGPPGNLSSTGTVGVIIGCIVIALIVLFPLLFWLYRRLFKNKTANLITQNLCPDDNMNNQNSLHEFVGAIPEKDDCNNGASTAPNQGNGTPLSPTEIDGTPSSMATIFTVEPHQCQNLHPSDARPNLEIRSTSAPASLRYYTNRNSGSGVPSPASAPPNGHEEQQGKRGSVMSTATGWTKSGYLSPEHAMAGGWRDEPEERVELDADG